MPQTKQQLRSAISARRKALDPQWKKAASAEIVARFQEWETFASAERIGLYLAIDGEVELDDLLAVCWHTGKRTAIPVFNHATHLYDMAEITAETVFHAGHYGIREPESPPLVSMREIDLIAVPGVAFNTAGDRLGRGGGYYDRLLDQYRGVSAAVAFDFQILHEIPVDAHDRPVNAIVTETKIVEVVNER